VRLVSNYIHNDEQLEYDVFRTQQIMKSIKKKTLTFKVPTLNIFVNLGDNVHIDKEQFDNMTCLNIKEVNDVVKNNVMLTSFPDIKKIQTFKEEGLDLFVKLTSDINSKAEKDAVMVEDVFKPKKPIVTYILIGLNILIFLLMYLLGDGSEDINTLINFGANNKTLVVNFHQYYRLLTSAFIHIGILHLFFNCYALKIIGSQVENFFGRTKYLIIYLGSALGGGLLSICFSNNISAGASGAIFGLLGALLYFGYHYRLYLGSIIRSQIVPIIIINLVFGFIVTGIDNSAHIGGLIGGILLSMAVGVKYKSKKSEIINGIILSIIFYCFMLFLLFK
ncbi:MAG: rhomboid family intramembrane serine protease, partial [Bacilli bacterium]